MLDQQKGTFGDHESPVDFQERCYADARRLGDDRALVECAEQWPTAQRSVSDHQASVEHIWRQVAFLYHDHVADRPSAYARTPWLVAQMLLGGGTIELMDGDAGNINVVFFQSSDA